MTPRDAVLALPKAELHLHIEGTLEPELALQLAAKHGVVLPATTVEGLRALSDFGDLQSFLDLYYACMAVLRTREDFRLLATEYLDRAAAQGVRHTELFFDPQAHIARGVDLDDVIDGLLDGLADAAVAHGMSGGLILCFLRDRPPAEAMAVLRSITHRVGDLIGVGLDSAEVGNPPVLFREVFAEARSLGLRCVAHAGEEGPASYIVQALDELQAERIDHGIRALEDPVLIDRLARDRTPLTVCPLSNVRLRAVPSLQDHPLLDLMEADVNVSVHSDDPAYFGGYVGDTLVALRDAVGLGLEGAALLARNSVRSSFASDARKAELLRAVDDWEARTLSAEQVAS